MKLIIGLLCAIGLSSAYAEVLATAKNNAGGEIVLTTNVGNCTNNQKAMFTRTPDGKVTFGCWFYEDGYVYVTYDTGTKRVYDGSGWEINPKFQSKKGNAL
jgi:hypothetical protein